MKHLIEKIDNIIIIISKNLHILFLIFLMGKNVIPIGMSFYCLGVIFVNNRPLLYLHKIHFKRKFGLPNIYLAISRWTFENDFLKENIL